MSIPHPGIVRGQEVPLKQCGVDAVGVVAFAYETYTNPSNDNGVLGGTVTTFISTPQKTTGCLAQRLLSGGGARDDGKGVPWLLSGSVLGQAGGCPSKGLRAAARLL